MIRPEHSTLVSVLSVGFICGAFAVTHRGQRRRHRYSYPEAAKPHNGPLFLAASCRYRHHRRRGSFRERAGTTVIVAEGRPPHVTPLVFTCGSTLPIAASPTDGKASRNLEHARERPVLRVFSVILVEKVRKNRCVWPL
jgi:hypothetical protein